jgi:hypothetical protein
MGKPVSFSRIPEDAAYRWQVVRDVCAGDQRLRDGDYLPFLNSIDRSQPNLDRNAAYRKRAVFYAATSFTRDGLLGLAFRIDPSAELPPKLEYLLKDADGAGNSIFQQSQAVLANNIEIGRHGLYVDFSAALNRPVIKSYLAEDIINWRYATVDGQRVLTMVVLREIVAEDEVDGFGVTDAVFYRELALQDGVCVCRLWKDGGVDATGGKLPDAKVALGVDDAGESLFELTMKSSAKALDFIPFQFVGSQNNDPEIDTSPLYGLAQVNVAHFRNSADFEDSVFYCGQPQAYITGLDENWRDHLENPMVEMPDGSRRPSGRVMYVGSRTPLMLPTGATFGFAQPEPNTLVKEALQQKEDQMRGLGARLIEPSAANKTATGEDNDREATTSVLSICVSNVSEAYQAAIGWCARYLDLAVAEGELAASYKINQDFVKLAADATVMTALVSAWQLGLMAKSDVRAFFRRLGVVSTERTDEDIDASLAKDGPAPVVNKPAPAAT